MLRLATINNFDKVELFRYENKPSSKEYVNFHYISILFNALENMSKGNENKSKIQHIMFSNKCLFFIPFKKFHIRLLFDESVTFQSIEPFTKELALETSQILAENEIDETKKIFQLNLVRIIEKFYMKSKRISKAPPPSKVALVGLALAGKTSIKNVFFDRWSAEEIKDIKPTIGIETSLKFEDFLRQKLLVKDFGGQSNFRQEYISRDISWKGIAAIVFVIDIQNRELFQIARDYLTDIWEIASRVNDPPPRLSIFLHKFDVEKRANLVENVNICLKYFVDYFDKGIFYFTTINDDSSNIALSKAFFFSLPSMVLKRLFEDFTNYFEKQIRLIADDFSYLIFYPRVLAESKADLVERSVRYGKEYSYFLQNAWIESLIGTYSVPETIEKQDSPNVIQKEDSIIVTLKDWSDERFPKEISNLITKGFLIGMLKTLTLDEPEMIEEKNKRTIWKISLR
ncbi:MAG: ADP-ribosylation factor-like protein [Promethearchaeota archaeon]